MPDIKLEDGDNIRVPNNPRQVLLMDALAKPGPYAIAEGTTLTLGEAIIRAGGTVAGRARQRYYLTAPRARDAPNAAGLLAIRASNITTPVRGKLSETIYLPLQPGDVVLVPQGKEGPSKISQGIQALSAFNLLRGFGF